MNEKKKRKKCDILNYKKSEKDSSGSRSRKKPYPLAPLMLTYLWPVVPMQNELILKSEGKVQPTRKQEPIEELVQRAIGKKKPGDSTEKKRKANEIIPKNKGDDKKESPKYTEPRNKKRRKSRWDQRPVYSVNSNDNFDEENLQKSVKLTKRRQEEKKENNKKRRRTRWDQRPEDVWDHSSRMNPVFQQQRSNNFSVNSDNTDLNQLALQTLAAGITAAINNQTDEYSINPYNFL